LGDFANTAHLDRYIRLLEKQVKRARKRAAYEGIKFGQTGLTAGNQTQVTNNGAGGRNGALSGGSEFEVVSHAPHDMPKSALRSGFHEPVGPPVPPLQSAASTRTLRPNQSFSLGPNAASQTTHNSLATLRKISLNAISRASQRDNLKLSLPTTASNTVSSPASPATSSTTINSAIQPQLIDAAEMARLTSDDADYAGMNNGSPLGTNNAVHRSQSFVGPTPSATNSPQLGPSASASASAAAAASSSPLSPQDSAASGSGSSMRPTASQGLTAQLTRVQSSNNRTRPVRPARNVIPVQFRAGTQPASGAGALPPVVGVVAINAQEVAANSMEENSEEIS
jgi:hypothetical protein